MTGVMNPDRLAELEDERRFLLRSLRDLDAEHAAGDVDDHDYATLRDGYTKRAADVLRAIEAGRAGMPQRRRATGGGGWRSSPPSSRSGRERDGWWPARRASGSAVRRSPAERR